MKKIQLILVIIGLVAIVSYAVSNLEFDNSSVDYVASIEMKRAETKRFFESSAESPVKNVKDFKGLFYFTPNQQFKVEAQLELFETPENILISSGKGDEPENYLKFAWANFELLGQRHKLLLLKQTLQDPFLFLAFSDKTSGESTYGGGRYLNVPYKKGQTKVDLDFNLAYHPYCVYNPKYVCPLPPAENNLAVAIEAGEKLSQD